MGSKEEIERIKKCIATRTRQLGPEIIIPIKECEMKNLYGYLTYLETGKMPAPEKRKFSASIVAECQKQYSYDVL